MRYVLVILGLLLVVGVLGGIKFHQISGLIAMGQKMEEAGPPPTAVGTGKAQKQTWEETQPAVGTVNPVRGVSINNEAPGVLIDLSFESGDRVKKGQVLARLDTRVERAQVKSARVRISLAKKNLERTRQLAKEGLATQAQLDADEAELSSARASLSVYRAQIGLKVIRAPFAGRLGIRQVNVGQYLNPGTALVDLESTDSVFVDFTLPQEMPVNLGSKVRISVEGDQKLEAEGVVDALDSQVDRTNRTLKVRARVKNQGERFKPGMFVQVSLVLPRRRTVVMVPRTALVRKTFGDSVFIVKEPEEEPKTYMGKPFKVVDQVFVKAGANRGDFIEIVEGVKAGVEVVSSGAFKLRNKARIVVENDVKPRPELDPKPENR